MRTLLALLTISSVLHAGPNKQDNRYDGPPLREQTNMLDGDDLVAKPYTLQTVEPGTSREVTFRTSTLKQLKELYKVLRGKKARYEVYTLRRINSYDYRVEVRSTS